MSGVEGRVSSNAHLARDAISLARAVGNVRSSLPQRREQLAAAVGNRSFSVVGGASATEAVVGAVEQRGEVAIKFAGTRSAWPLSSDAISSSNAQRRWMDCRIEGVRRVCVGAPTAL